ILTPASNAIKVEFVCGYSNPDEVPQDIKVALKLLVEHWFTNRGESSKIPKAVESTIFKHKLWTL
ncbi:MAG: phage gp6-like head-tail connector protein, partial [Thermodesulfovibrionia bacterium]|nr:phage gp6-like head-tail connector protein [Thermodesulfovibrionia bacterium]